LTSGLTIGLSILEAMQKMVCCAILLAKDEALSEKAGLKVSWGRHGGHFLPKKPQTHSLPLRG
jgi:hypothetical protein